MKKKVIAVFTGNRAEYGLQYPVLKAIDKHPNLEYKLIVSGAHLDTNFGSTLDEIAKDRTTVVIAHRLSTVTDADEIIVLDNGEIKERGTHASLLNQDGLYATMWARQQALSDAELRLQALHNEDGVAAP